MNIKEPAGGITSEEVADEIVVDESIEALPDSEMIKWAESDKLSSADKFLIGQALNYPRLNPMEQRKLIKLYVNGRDSEPNTKAYRLSQDAREELINRTLRLPLSFARKNIGRGLPFVDLVEEGIFGLIKGLEKFDPDRGYELSTYVSWWIRQAINRAVLSEANPLRHPEHIATELGKIGRARDQLINSGEEVTLKKLSEGAKIPLAKTEEIIYKTQPPVELDQPLRTSEEGVEVRRHLFDRQTSGNPEDNLLRFSAKQRVDLAISKLARPLDRRVILERYGLVDGVEKTYKEIGEGLGVCGQYARQIEAATRQRLLEDERASALLQSARELFAAYDDQSEIDIDGRDE